jgi:hypothetical protein
LPWSEQHSPRGRLFSPANCYIWSIALYDAETWTLRKVDQKHLENFEGWCCRRIDEISWTDRVSNKKNITKSQGGEECPTYNKMKEG